MPFKHVAEVTTIFEIQRALSSGMLSFSRTRVFILRLPVTAVLIRKSQVGTGAQLAIALDTARRVLLEKRIETHPSTNMESLYSNLVLTSPTTFQLRNTIPLTLHSLMTFLSYNSIKHPSSASP
ncbi:unnamed protein product [Adineta ricciae]|uniref:Uncharacterized protein n=1 Tax=Adineta ricciae TaxID=249248 RepID=A0A815ZTY9_ADIRI|nr:unnamed protein product [Adineta ricciae]